MEVVDAGCRSQYALLMLGVRAGAPGMELRQVLSFKYDSPSLLSNEKDPVLPVVGAYGTGAVRIVGRCARGSIRVHGRSACLEARSLISCAWGLVGELGRFLFETNSTVVTRVTIGGTSAGMPIPVKDVTMGELVPGSTPSMVRSGRRLGSEPNQYVLSMQPNALAA